MIETLLPAAMYAETHFRLFGWTPSALFRREPEIVFDMPRRLARGRDLPVTLLINDVHLYPIQPESIRITVSRGRKIKPELIEFDCRSLPDYEIEHPLKSQTRAYVFTIPRPKPLFGEDNSGEIFVNACLRYRRIDKKGALGKTLYTVLNDNLAMSSKYSYRCVIADDEYPGADLCAFGDLHTHSLFSRSHVEFGPPLRMIDAVAAAGGLEFVAVTDHSYDLACDPDNFLRQESDPRLWDMYISSINNSGRETILIPAEEISVLNSKGKAVHLCGIGISEYVPGTLDGARRGIRTNKQLTVSAAVDEISRQGGLSFAAHPGSRAGFMQRLFLRRGNWSSEDLCPKLGGIQAVNSGFFDSWIRGRALWINMLQRGLKTPLLAGSDAHGDFNRYRAIGVPFLQVRETAERYMGFVRTGIYGKPVDIGGIISAIGSGATFVTNGPLTMICDGRQPEKTLIGAKPIDADEMKNITVRAVSTKEFGAINVVRVIMGCPGKAGETMIMREVLPDNTYDAAIPVPVEPLSETCYLRAEVFGKSPRDLPTTAATSACFIGY